MTDEERPVCDCPEPCGCHAEGYAQGKAKGNVACWVSDKKEKDRSKTGPMPSIILAPDVYSAAANSFSPSSA
jgi:hypothetical protein